MSALPPSLQLFPFKYVVGKENGLALQLRIEVSLCVVYLAFKCAPLGKSVFANAVSRNINWSTHGGIPMHTTFPLKMPLRKINLSK